MKHSPFKEKTSTKINTSWHKAKSFFHSISVSLLGQHEYNWTSTGASYFALCFQIERQGRLSHFYDKHTNVAVALGTIKPLIPGMVAEKSPETSWYSF